MRDAAAMLMGDTLSADSTVITNIPRTVGQTKLCYATLMWISERQCGEIALSK
jgi:hypothetical protein